MRVRDSIGLNLSPLILRVMLGITFIWAGAGKFLMDFQFSPEQTAALANMGAIEVAADIKPLLPVAAPDATVAAEAQPKFLPEQFPQGVNKRALLMLALLMDSAAHPAFNDDGVEPMPLWPSQLASGKWPVYLAFAVAATELIAGLLMIFGLFTRLGAIGLVSVMLGAIWLTQIGPAMQSGHTQFGFLPDWGAFETNSIGESMWFTLLFQFALLASAGAVFFLGAGGLSIDRVIFGGKRKGPKPEAGGESHD